MARYNGIGETQTHRLWLGGLTLLLVLIGLSVLSIFIGTRAIAPGVTWQAIWQFDPTNNAHLLVHYLRLPRAALAVVVGAALGLAGAVMQALTRNPLADPGILGVNAGATLAIVLGISLLGISQVVDYVWLGLVGAALPGVALYFLSGVKQGGHPVRLVLSGAALSVVLLALTQMITINSDETVFNQFRHWAVGSLQGRGFAVLWPVLFLTVIGSALGCSLCTALNATSLGDEVSRSLGVNPKRITLLACVVIVVLSAAATAAAGPISFVGLTAPHLARFITGPDHRWLLPYTMLIAALLVQVADILGRVIGYPDEISVGIMVALLGGPFFVYLVRRWKIAQL